MDTGRAVVGAHVVVAGAGGNIASSLVGHVARMPEVARLTLIDRDHYGPENLAGQSIVREDVGRLKALVQAERARAIRSDLRVTPVVADLEALPMGLFTCDLILSCLDSRRARMAVNQVAWRMGVRWIDAGVLADGLLARIDSFLPGAEGPCLECGWSAEDYRLLGQEYECRPGIETATGPTRSGTPFEPPPTAAPSALGGLAASLQALEAQRLLQGSPAGLEPGHQVVVVASHHRLMRSVLPMNPECRFDHGVWHIEPLDRDPASIDLAELLALGRSRLESSGTVEVSVEGRRFVRQEVCSGCGDAVAGLRLTRIPGSEVSDEGLERGCPGCAAPLDATGWGMSERLSEADVEPSDLHRPLAALGVRGHEVVTVLCGRGGAAVHFRTGTAASESLDDRCEGLDEVEECPTAERSRAGRGRYEREPEQE